MIKISWITLASIISLALGSRLKIYQRKIVMKRASKLLVWFRTISMCIGKFIRLKVKIKYFKGMRVTFT